MGTTEIFRFSESAMALSEEGAFKYLALGREAEAKGLRVISFGIGQPDFKTPRHIVEACKEALDRGLTGYGPSAGLPELRRAIAAFTNESYGTDVKPEEVLVTVGAKAAVFAAIVALVRKGDRVLVPDPSYPMYECVVRFAGGIPEPYPLREAEGWSLDLDDLGGRIEGARMIILNNPHNPTGSTLGRDELDELLSLARREGVVVVSDEIYDRFVYEGKHNTVLADPGWRDFVIYVNGFSKTFSMTGWRLGYVIANSRVIERFRVLLNNVYSCPSTFVQAAAIRALEAGLDWFEGLRREYAERARLLTDLLNGIDGVSVVRPRGAFYTFPNISGLLKRIGYDSAERMVVDLLFDTGVLMLPGTAFPFRAGEGHLRVAFTIPSDLIREGMEKFREWVEEKTQG